LKTVIKVHLIGICRRNSAAAMIAALALLDTVQAFSAPAMRVAPTRSSAVSMFSEGDLGVLPPLGVYDPLGLIETRNMCVVDGWRGHSQPCTARPAPCSSLVAACMGPSLDL
jgi:hypothetical protein